MGGMNASSDHPQFVLVQFLSEDWDEPPVGFTRRQLVEALSRRLAASGCPTLCVERPLCPFTTIARSPRKAAEAIAGNRGLRPTGEMSYLMTPISFLRERLAWRVPALARINRLVVAKQVVYALRRLGWESMPRVSWIFHPYHAHMLGALGELASVYECYDEYAAGTYISSRQVGEIHRLEQVVLDSADLVFTTSRRLYETRSSGRESTYLVPNGVDFELLAPAANGIRPAEDLERIPQPRIGFVGKISRKVDLNLIAQVASRKPHWQIVILGHCAEGKSYYRKELLPTLGSMKNVHLLGTRPLPELSRYLRGFDVCVIPYVKEEITSSIYPLKINEYLAAGKPVVSTDFADLSDFGDLVEISSDTDGFVSAIERCLNVSSNPDLVRRRQAVAMANSWDARATFILDRIREKIAGKLQVAACHASFAEVAPAFAKASAGRTEAESYSLRGQE